jgi:hypothetical protein
MFRIRVVSPLLALTIVLAATVIWLANKGPTGACADTAAVDGARRPQIYPRSIVVKPWYGPHHVYGFFVVPERFDFEQLTATLWVGNFHQPADLHKPPSTVGFESIPGHYVKKVYLPTHAAMGFLISGHFGDLRLSCNWILRVVEPDDTTNAG